MIFCGIFFFHFCKILIFWVVKGQKTVQNDKTFSLSHSISQEPHIIWFSFMAHICKMIISPGVLLNFLKILMFRVFSEVKWPKNVERSISMMGEVSWWWEKYLSKYLSMVEVSLEVSRWWEEYLSKRSPLKHTCSWRDKLIVLWILNREAKIFLHISKRIMVKPKGLMMGEVSLKT